MNLENAKLRLTVGKLMGSSEARPLVVISPRVPAKGPAATIIRLAPDSLPAEKDDQAIGAALWNNRIAILVCHDVEHGFDVFQDLAERGGLLRELA
jgi:hypothetical protein